MATLPSIDQERAIVERVLASLDLPTKVRTPLFEFREDHSGEESIFITFPVQVTRNKPLTAADWKGITAFLQAVGTVLGDAGLQRFPYIALSEITR